MNELEVAQRLTKVEESVQSAHHRINNTELMQREIRDLALSVNTLAGSVHNMCDDLTDVSGRVKDIECKPSKRLDQIIGYIIGALVSGAIGFWLSQVLSR